jgi:acetylornithine deacetylase/succinyl-diaminopimelate desuccinylase-like protein
MKIICRFCTARFLACVVVLFFTAVTVPAQGGQQSPRPSFPQTTTESFDAASVPAYRGNHAKAYAYIDGNLPQHIENLRRWVRQRSVSAQNDGVREMAAMLRDDLKTLGFKEAEVVPTSGHPGVWGYYDAGADKTLAVYMMYDVQPIEPTGWQVNAFEGSIIDHPLGRVLMARGATNQKGPQRAFLNAIEAIIKSGEGMPVNLMVLAEGEEELGSPHYPELIERYKDRLKTASGVLFPFNGQGGDGSVGMTLGVKGIVYFELEASGNEKGGPKTAEVHGSLKAITDSPAWRLTQALASLTSPDGNTIMVDGYYTPIRKPSPEEERLVNGMMSSWNEREAMMLRGLGIERWADGLTGRDTLMRYLFDTTLNINGMWSGYTGPGVKTILPHVATAKVDSRLVPNQTPDEALRLIRAHLDKHGFSDIIIRKISGYPPAQTSVDTPLVRSMIGAYRKYGFTPSVAPRLAGSAPYYVFTDTLGLPLVAGGLGHGSGAHAPNEYMVIEPREGSRVAGLAEIEKFYVDMLFALSAAKE